MATLEELFQTHERTLRERKAAHDDATFDKLSDKLAGIEDRIMRASVRSLKDLAVKARFVALIARRGGCELPPPYVERLSRDAMALTRR